VLEEHTADPGSDARGLEVDRVHLAGLRVGVAVLAGAGDGETEDPPLLLRHQRAPAFARLREHHPLPLDPIGNVERVQVLVRKLTSIG
jgi:hypothetical protein